MSGFIKVDDIQKKNYKSYLDKTRMHVHHDFGWLVG